MIRILTLVVLTLGLSACGSVLGGSTQDLTIETPGANDAVCYIHNGDLRYRAWPPETIKISKRPGDLEVKCVADGNREKTVIIEQRGHAAALGNVFNGIIPGTFADYHSGGLFEYPALVSVDFTDIQAGTMPLPNYHKHLMENPDLFGMEEFRPGRAALMRDKYDKVPALKKREFPNFNRFSEFSNADETGGSDSQGAESSQDGDQTQSSSSQSSGAPNDLVSDLTKQMNPEVFGPASEGFIGGTADIDAGPQGVEAGPVTIYPVPEPN